MHANRCSVLITRIEPDAIRYQIDCTGQIPKVIVGFILRLLRIIELVPFCLMLSNESNIASIVFKMTLVDHLLESGITFAAFSNHRAT